MSITIHAASMLTLTAGAQRSKFRTPPNSAVDARAMTSANSRGF
jgi:hypothetical protein